MSFERYLGAATPRRRRIERAAEGEEGVRKKRAGEEGTRLRCTFASAILNTAIQKTLPPLTRPFSRSSSCAVPFTSLSIVAMRGEAEKEYFRLCGNDKRDKKREHTHARARATTSFRVFPISGERYGRGEGKVAQRPVTFSRPLSVNNVYLPQPSFAFFRCGWEGARLFVPEI